MPSPTSNGVHNGKHRPTIAATATAVPPHTLTREDVKTYMRKVFDIDERRLDVMMTVIDRAQVHKRHTIFPVDYILQPRTLEQRSRQYQEHAVRLGRQAAEGCPLFLAGTLAVVQKAQDRSAAALR